jgi:hypothetical protein
MPDDAVSYRPRWAVWLAITIEAVIFLWSLRLLPVSAVNGDYLVAVSSAVLLVSAAGSIRAQFGILDRRDARASVNDDRTRKRPPS